VGFLNIQDFASDGCAGYCVKVVSNAHGASERLVISPAHPEDGILEMPGGQSGQPFSRHYRDQQAAWQTGETAAFLLGDVVSTLEFQP
jgi:penicillin amidase